MSEDERERVRLWRDRSLVGLGNRRELSTDPEDRYWGGAGPLHL